jgi:nucleoid-associated protein YgaU
MSVARKRAGGLAAVENGRQGQLCERRGERSPARAPLRVVRSGERRSLYLIGGAQRAGTRVQPVPTAGRAGARKIKPAPADRREAASSNRPLRAASTSTRSAGTRNAGACGAGACGDAGRRAPVRLTRRGRLAVQVAVVAMASLAFAGIAAASKAAPGVWTTRGDHAVVVHEGDTLWTIAARQMPGADRREVVEAIRQLNGLHGTRIEVGQQLILPLR